MCGIHIVARCIVFAGACLSLFYPARFIQAEHTLDEIRAIVSEELGSVHSIRLKYKTTITSHPPYNLGDGTLEIEWIRDGDKRLRVMKPRQGRDGRWFGSFRSYDGTTTHSVVFDANDPTKYAKVAQVKGFTAGDWKSTNPEFCLGQRILSTEESLITLLARPQATLLGAVEIDGFRCVHVDLGTVTESNGVEWAAKAWLSPDRHYLPVKLTFEANSEAPASKKVGLVPNPLVIFRNLKWGQFEDKALKRVRHYPTQSEFDCPLSLNVFEVTEISINEPALISEFQPQPQFGTEVILRTGPRDPYEQRYIAGGPEAVREHQKKLVEAAMKSVPTASGTETPVDARPNEGQWVTHMWKLALIFCLLTSGYCFYRSRRMSS